ncbi:MAG: adenosylcobinamide-GDP ribazoletransferase [Actinobacteria bacterium]|nr:adenosylcobinamide-GDP ribazoletransferase [Actinomycetota bacterium]
MRAALAFLTVLPVRGAVGPGRRTLAAFPAAGAVVGLAWWAAAVAGRGLGGAAVGAAAVLVADLIVTGGLHLDAVGDVTDAWASGRRGDAARDVIRDPRVGAVGAAGVGTVLLARFALLATTVPVALVAVPTAGRLAMVWTLGRLPAAAGSLSSDLAPTATATVRWVAVGSATVIAAAAARAAGVPLTRAVIVGGVAAATAVTTAVALAAWWRHRYGFACGDAVGLAGIVAELVALAVLVAAL